MKDCTQLVQELRDTIPDVPREFANVIVNGVRNATSMVSSAIRNYGSVYGQNQMLEYSVDGKISDVTSSFSGREAISNSVLANLANELTTLKSDYDAAWSTLPPVTETRQANITEELSASFSVGSGAAAPESDCYIELGYNSTSVRFSVWERNPRSHVCTLTVTWTADSATLTGSVPGADLTVASLLQKLPGSIEITPSGRPYSSFVQMYGGGNASFNASLITIAIGGRLTFIVGVNNHVYTFIGGGLGTNVSALNIPADDVADRASQAQISVPSALINANLNSNNVGGLTYSVPDGPSTITVTQEVSKEVSYEITYNALPYEGNKIQNLIDALP